MSYDTKHDDDKKWICRYFEGHLGRNVLFSIVANLLYDTFQLHSNKFTHSTIGTKILITTSFSAQTFSFLLFRTISFHASFVINNYSLKIIKY